MSDSQPISGENSETELPLSVKLEAMLFVARRAGDHCTTGRRAGCGSLRDRTRTQRTGRLSRDPRPAPAATRGALSN